MADITKPLAELEEKWRNEALAEQATIAYLLRQVAGELHALRAQLDEAIQGQANDHIEASRKLRFELDNARAELAALREPIACGHPRACWVETDPAEGVAPHCQICVLESHIKELNASLETACARERLRVAAALREAASKVQCEVDNRIRYTFEKLKIDPKMEDVWPHGEAVRDSVLALLSDSDCSALDAHDAEVRNLALEEAAIECDGAADAIRALKMGGSK